MVEAAVLVLFPLLVIYAAFSDLFTMTIANRVSLILIAGFAVLAPVTGLGLETIGLHVMAGLAVLALGFFFFSMGWIGGGDAKFAAAVTLWLGWSHALEYVVIFCFLGGLLTLGILYFRSQEILPNALMRFAFVRRLHDNREGVPYGIALSIAALALYPQTVWMQAIVG